MERIKQILKPRLALIEGQMHVYCPKQMDGEFLKRVYEASYGHDEAALTRGISDPMWDILARGGKRWRPVLFLLTLEALGSSSSEYVAFSTVFEVIHNATLVIDDIEDGGTMRRGQPCVHIAHGNDVSINAANAAYFLPLMAVRELHGKVEDSTLLRLYEVYGREMTLLHLGQGVDIVWHSGKYEDALPTVEQYLEMAAGKTGALSRMAVSMAAVLAGVDDSAVAALASFAETIGVAFQIHDDILDLTSSAFHDLKGVGGDITEGKLSLVALHALQKDSGRLNEILRSHTSDPEVIQEAIQLIRDQNSFQFAAGKARELVIEAWARVDSILAPSQAKEDLQAFAHYLIEREI